MAAKKPTPKKTTAGKSKPASKKSNRSLGQKIKWFFIKAALWFFGISIAWVVIFKYVPVFFTPLMVIRVIENKMSDKEIYFDHNWEPIEKISKNLQKAVIASEDGTFLYHNGFDFKALQKAYKSNERGRRIRGGSTISQQTAKNVFLWQGKSYFRKGLEAYFTVLIELIWGKERIMEVYLNSIEMGDGVYGAYAATEYWYRRDASSLTPMQAAGIAAILPNPRKFKATGSSSYINRRKERIIREMRAVGKINYDGK
ncbi:monofunctional biosynthetic peptidoglycan transglycosylase [Flavobacterium hibisci]|uniref:monofunctional biosynthetic peptidoglycan transglycosylase n=1 Tax=Flavobacterium hibisci TaxID=1914462 RepID=UPI001CC00631|nr:monofunctional biosynthetic peptidoglycan transglycosylase [Flavobacterium hibisci]MBZ4043475.1 monofunctional biosynthetic peptidoglycan transglycosylase [Flavobacterium hibisci]